MTKAVTDIYAEFSQIRLPILLPEQHAAPNLEAQCEIRPTDLAVVFRAFKDRVELTRMRWGLVPWFHRGPVKAWKLATFNGPRRNRKDGSHLPRCLRAPALPTAADGWVEWKGEGKPKRKFYIDRRDDAPICFAGLWDRCSTDDAGDVESFTMVTQPPGALSDIHDRAPVVLTQSDWARWLDPAADVDDLLATEAADHFRIRPYADLASLMLGPI